MKKLKKKKKNVNNSKGKENQRSESLENYVVGAWLIRIQLLIFHSYILAVRETVAIFLAEKQLEAGLHLKNIPCPKHIFSKRNISAILCRSIGN